MRYEDITIDLAEKWLENKNINPLTGRKIKTESYTYNLYDRFVKEYLIDNFYEEELILGFEDMNIKDDDSSDEQYSDRFKSGKQKSYTSYTNPYDAMYRYIKDTTFQQFSDDEEEEYD